ncbi:RNA polymerase sigma-70 factor [Filimonas effusa]|uniref:RNA polymerase sigma-70 factor n=1 Tax=Filimonas effusa TaxID=2508721 RepID=A0A4Q1D290_9BACT|nr:RNA polymerase sigma-70 factor [Filimonas effusa]RXK81191.1 RNA polymerase sigma-70 factor [Filimonas effusa]
MAFILNGDNLHNEELIWRRLATGDEAAFRALFHSYNPGLYAAILKVVKTEEIAREMVQDVFLRVWQHREAVGLMEKPEGWLFRVASNLSLSYLRRQAVEYKWLNSVAGQEGNTDDTLNKVSFREAQQLLLQAIHALPPKRQLIFRLSREEQLSHAEIAEKLNMSQNTVKNQIVLARQSIEDFLKQRLGVYIPLFVLLELFF